MVALDRTRLTGSLRSRRMRWWCRALRRAFRCAGSCRRPRIQKISLSWVLAVTGAYRSKRHPFHGCRQLAAPTDPRGTHTSKRLLRIQGSSPSWVLATASTYAEQWVCAMHKPITSILLQPWRMRMKIACASEKFETDPRNKGVSGQCITRRRRLAGDAQGHLRQSR